MAKKAKPNKGITVKQTIDKVNEIDEVRQEWLSDAGVESWEAYLLGDFEPVAGSKMWAILPDGTARLKISASIVEMALDLGTFLMSHAFDPDALIVVKPLHEFCEAIIDWAYIVKSRSGTDWAPNSTPDAMIAWKVFDGAVRNGVRESKRRFPAPTESVADLAALPGMTRNQIARTYNWFTENGDPDVEKVREELAKPGTHFDPKNWESREVGDRRKRYLKWFEEREPIEIRADLFTKTDPANARAGWKDPGISPEPLEMLLRLPNMPDEQIARMKKISLEEVRAARKRMYIVGTPQDATKIHPELEGDPSLYQMSPEQLQQRVDETTRQKMAGIDTYSEMQSMPDQVAAIINDYPDLEDAQIVAALRSQHPSITVDAVSFQREMIEYASQLGIDQLDQSAIVEKLADNEVAPIPGASIKQLQRQLVEALMERAQAGEPE